MVLSAALDKGLIVLSLIAILTSVIGAIYYLSIIKEMFFNKPEYKYNKNLDYFKLISDEKIGDKVLITKYEYLKNCYSLSSPISFIISFITLIILLFLFLNKEWLSMGTVLVQILFNS